MTIAEKFTTAIGIVEALAKGEEIEMERVEAVIEFLAERKALAAKSSNASRNRSPKPEKLEFYARVKEALSAFDEPVTAKAVTEAMDDETVTPQGVRGALTYLAKHDEVNAFPGDGKSPKTYQVA